ncbi:MAG: DUF5916 domain-containing protein [Candidatus Kapaibacteriota bacterium]
MKNFLLRFLLSLILCAFGDTLFAQEAFLPPEIPPEVSANRITAPMTIDGILSEEAWRSATLYNGFLQQNPIQGAAPSNETEVRILYDAQFLYISAVCRDSIAQYGIRVQNMRRDFSLQQNDFFGVNIDSYLDKRNSFGFYVTPNGAQSDRQFGGEYTENVDWDALWFARTSLSDSGWTVEMAIPWKTLRYKEGCTRMGIIFSRGLRRTFEVVTFPPIPRAFSPDRMVYEALLTNIAPPPPTANVLVNPYVLAEANRAVQGSNDVTNAVFKPGGEVKWAITPNSTLEATINTDFAQADVDRQVVNLSRFSVFFPERRQFFLENAQTFYTGFDRIQPFFSRSIGLDNVGAPVPIDAGLRYLAQTPEENVGALAMRQRGTSDSPASWFGIARYSKNVGEQSKIGGLITLRQDESFTRADGTRQTSLLSGTATIDGVYRPSQLWGAAGMVSMSVDPAQGTGIAAAGWTGITDTWGYVGLQGEYMSRSYRSRTGFLGFENYINANPEFDLDLRPEWLPSWIRSYSPDGDVDWFWTADGRFLQGDIQASLFSLTFQDGAEIEYRPQQAWQMVDSTFQPLGIAIADGLYTYTRHRFALSTDQSAMLGGSLRYQTGAYFDGALTTFGAEVRFAPIPNIELSASYEFNQIRGVGRVKTNLDTHLFTANARLALNPQVQVIGFYQWNSAAGRAVWNARLSWEYLPLSFIYLVFNSNDAPFGAGGDRIIRQQGIAKITLLRQL